MGTPTVDVRLGSRVTNLNPMPGGRWRVSGTDSSVAGIFQLDADGVLVSTGFDRIPVLPEWAQTAEMPLIHAGAYRNTSQLSGKAVLVVGAGTSGLEIAVAAARCATRVWLSSRTAPLTVARQWHGLALTPAARLSAAMPAAAADALLRVTARMCTGDLSSYGLTAPAEGTRSRLARTGHGIAVVDGLRPLLESGAIQTVPAVTGTDGTRVLLADGQQLNPDLIIAATGYRPGLESLLGNLDVLGPTGRPQRALPGLAFAGYDLPLAGQLPALRSTARRNARNLHR